MALSMFKKLARGLSRTRENLKAGLASLTGSASESASPAESYQRCSIDERNRSYRSAQTWVSDAESYSWIEIRNRSGPRRTLPSST